MASVEQTPGLGNSSQVFRIIPSNSPSDGVFAHIGNPVVSWELPSSNLLLDPSTLRIAGKIRWKQGSVTAGTDSVRLNQYLGVNGCFENVSWSSKNSRAVIEKILNYPKLLNSINPALQDTQNFQSESCNEYLATQNNTFMDKEMNASLFGDPAPPYTPWGCSFSTPIFTGLTMASGNRLPLMALGGLLLSIDLASNQAAIISNDVTQSPQYELYDLSLTGSYYVPAPEEREALAQMTEGEIEMNTFSSLFAILQSTTHNSVFSLGMRQLISTYFSFVPASYINNYSQDQYQNMRITQSTASNQIVKLNFLRNGSQMPFLFDLDVVTADPQGSNEGQLTQFYLMSLKKLTDLTKTAISTETQDIRTCIGSPGFLQSGANQMLKLNKENYTLGVPFDIMGDLSGADFNSQPLTIDIRSTLDNATPNAIYFFTLSKTMVVYSPMGVRVIN